MTTSNASVVIAPGPQIVPLDSLVVGFSVPVFSGVVVAVVEDGVGQAGIAAGHHAAKASRRFHQEAVAVCIRALQKGGWSTREFDHELIIIADSMEDMDLTKSTSLFSSAGEILEFVLGRITDEDVFLSELQDTFDLIDPEYLFLRFAGIAHQAARGEEEQARLQTLMKLFVRLRTVRFRRKPTFHAVAWTLWPNDMFADEMDLHTS